LPLIFLVFSSKLPSNSSHFFACSSSQYSKFVKNFGSNNLFASSLSKILLKNTSFLLLSSLLCPPSKIQSLYGKLREISFLDFKNLSPIVKPILWENAV
jgi:hypothetical protein